MSFSFFISVKTYPNDLATLEFHKVFLTSHLNYHERDSHHKELDADDKEEVGHSHTHKHSDGEEEHTHKHVNIVTYSDMIIFQSGNLIAISFDIYNSMPMIYNHLFSNPFTLEILRPPIYS